MNSSREAIASDRFEFHDLSPVSISFRDDVLRGLALKQKTIPAKYFYDDRGSELFEAICDLPEYYPTRTELHLMRRYASEMAQLIGPQSLLIEYGSGASTKTRILIEAARPAAYMPIDISRGLLMATAEELVDAYQDLHVVAVCADYSKPFRLPDFSEQRYRKRVIYFPGSTIGNFTPAETQAFFANVLTLLRAGDVFLVGVDLVKNPLVLHDAYNDAQGVTAAFNLNVLQRINRELDANFDLSRFQHHAFYNATEKRIEMHLVSLVRQSVCVAQRPFAFDVGETIHTEISCKYSLGDFQSLARSCGMQALQVWVDQDQLFSVHCLAAA